MKTALITPISDLASFAHADRIHLTLAHLIGVTGPYTTFYIKKKIAGDYIIVDNSAHEFRKPMPSDQLLKRAIIIRADEVVMPDVPYKGPETVELTDLAFKMWTKYLRVELEELKPQLMLVPQGSSLEEWRSCLFALILKWQRATKEFSALFRKEPPVIGLPAKYQAKFPGADIGKMIREWLRPLNDNGFKIHLLGWRELWRLNELALEFPWIRSIDSAKPFVYGQRGIMWDPLNEPEPAHVERPDKYFTLKLTSHQIAVSQHNVDVFRRLAKGNYKNGVKK